MHGYDYGNTRLRAMRSRLLPRETIESWARFKAVSELLNALTQTRYHRAVEAALARTSGLAAVREALRQHTVRTLGPVTGYYEGASGQAVRTVFLAYDVRNLRAVFRGVARQVAPDRIARSLIPVGELETGILLEITHADDLRAAVDRLATLRLSMARPLLELRARRPEAGLSDVDLALQRWYFQQAHTRLEGLGGATQSLLEALNREADLVNLGVALRLARALGASGARERVVGENGAGLVFVEPGRISHQRLRRALDQPEFGRTIRELSVRPFDQPLRAGYREYERTARLSAFERHLYRFHLDWCAGRIARDPLGIGVLVGYESLLSNEIRNLRWIAQGIHWGLTAAEIGEQLTFVD